MKLSQTILKLRTDAGLSQEQLAEKLDVSRQAIQKWEKGTSVPELGNLVLMSKLFNVSLDALVEGDDTAGKGYLSNGLKIEPVLEKMHSWEVYSSRISTEYRQSYEEGLDIEQHKEVFEAVSKMPNDEDREKMADV